MAAVEIAKEALLDEVRKFGNGTADIDAVTMAVEHVIETARAPRASGLDDANNAARTSDNNNGVSAFEAVGIILAHFFLSILYCLLRFKKYSNKYRGNLFVDTTYFVVITTLTIGYGGIYPATIGDRIFTILMVLLGGIVVSHLGKIVIEPCKSWLKKRFFPTVVGWKEEAMLLLFSLLAAGFCIVIGMVGIFLFEHQKSINYKMTLFEALYLSVMSLATVGYGDLNFQMTGGRIFAIPWLLICRLIFSESTKFFTSSSFKRLRYINKANLKKWINICSKIFLNNLPVVYVLVAGVLLLVMVFVIN